MPRYLIERTMADIRKTSMNSREKEIINFINNNSECSAIWIYSFISNDYKKTFCIYEAPTPEAVRKAAVKNNLPVDKITEINVLDPYLARYDDK